MRGVPPQIEPPTAATTTTTAATAATSTQAAATAAAAVLTVRSCEGLPLWAALHTPAVASFQVGNTVGARTVVAAAHWSRLEACMMG